MTTLLLYPASTLPRLPGEPKMTGLRGRWTPRLYEALTALGWKLVRGGEHDLRLRFEWVRTRDQSGVVWDRIANGFARGENRPSLPRSINGACRDTSKTRTEAAMVAAFGYSSFVDPRTHAYVSKTELQAKKGTFSLARPGTPLPKHHVPQRLIDTRAHNVFVEVRVLVAGDTCQWCFLKHKRERFSDKGNRVWWERTDDHLTREEQTKLLAMMKHMHVDYAEVDMLRDRNDSRIYPVDVNTTPSNGAFQQLGAQHGQAARRRAARDYGEAFAAAFDTPTWRITP